MAERRMFAKTIIDSDAFLEMPLSAQALYFHLSMRADDEGFVGNPKRIRGMIGASEDDLKLLLVKRFLLAFDSGVVVIKHWKIHNYIQSDRAKPTTYIEEKNTLCLDGKKAYTEKVNSECIQNVSNLYPQVSIGKDSIGKDSIGYNVGETPTEKTASRFTPPTVGDVRAYCDLRQNGVDPQRFVDYYTSKGWMIGKNKMKDWQAAVRTWERSGRSDENRVTDYDGFGEN